MSKSPTSGGYNQDLHSFGKVTRKGFLFANDNHNNEAVENMHRGIVYRDVKSKVAGNLASRKKA